MPQLIGLAAILCILAGAPGALANVAGLALLCLILSPLPWLLAAGLLIASRKD